MIKLELPPKPQELTDEVQQLLTDKYKETGKAVWNEPFIKEALLTMSHRKCAYSESRLQEEGKFMEVEHFKCKNLYPDDVVVWGNLLPSNKKCNGIKGAMDVIATPIVNPLVDTPSDHLCVSGYRYYGKDDKGKLTIKMTAINDRGHFIEPRSRDGERIICSLNDNFTHLKDVAGNTPIELEKIERIKIILRECDVIHPYSAVLSTTILYECPLYKEIKEYLTEKGLWDDELKMIEQELMAIALPK